MFGTLILWIIPIILISGVVKTGLQSDWSGGEKHGRRRRCCPVQDPEELAHNLMGNLGDYLRKEEDRDSFLNLFSSQTPIIMIGEYCQSPPACCAAYPDPTTFNDLHSGLLSHWDMTEIAVTRDSDISAKGQVWFHYPAPHLRTVVSNFTALWMEQRDCSYRVAGLTLVSVGCQLSASTSCISCNSLLG